MFLLCILSIVVFIAGCGGNKDNGNNPGTYSVSGKVIDPSTQQGISGASVSALLSGGSGNPVTVTTNSNGTYTLSLPNGTYNLTVTATGFKPNSLNNLAVNSDLSNISFAPVSTSVSIGYCSLSGRVVDANGKPVSNALVSVNGGTITNGVFASETTDSNGSYFIFAVPLEVDGKALTTVNLSASKNGASSSSKAVTLSTDRTIYVENLILQTSGSSGTSIYEDKFETNTSWAATGFWHRQANSTTIKNLAVPTYATLPPNDTSNGYLPQSFSGSYCYWYGEASTGNFMWLQQANDPTLSGGTSQSENEGTLTSPAINIPADSNPVLTFMTWFEIESVNPNSEGYDLMIVEISQDNGSTFTELGKLNPYTDPLLDDRKSLAFTSGGFNRSANWVPFQVNLSSYKGKSVFLRFNFRTADNLYNGFRGWFIDDVKIINSTSTILSKMNTLQKSTGLKTPHKR